MKIAFFNATQVGSTGAIVKSLATSCQENGHEVLCFFGQEAKAWGKIPCFFTVRSKAKQYWIKAEARLTGKDGFVNKRGTKNAIKALKDFAPDLIHLHNMHGEWVNFELIIKFAKENSIPVVLTVHDCWIETGRCAHYSYVGCSKYKEMCGKCPFRANYPKLYGFDRSRYYWKKKRECLEGISLILSPSHWLADEIKGSGITNNIKVIGNPYDQTVFNQKDGKASSNAKTLGFVSFSWSEEKGLSMAKKIADHYLGLGYRVVFVGMGEDDPRLPKGATAIPKTNSREEMADLYRSFDCFVNATRQDIFSMVNLEAIACGTPVVCSKVGGACEMLTDEWSRGIVRDYSLNEFIATIDSVLANHPKGKPSAINNLSQIAFGAMTLGIYERLLSQKANK